MKCSISSSGFFVRACKCASALVFWAPPGALAQNASDYILLGGALRSRPAYDGSTSQRADLIPVLRYYGEPWFARTTQGALEAGARMELAPGLDLGAQLAYEAGRLSDESAFLRARNVPDLNPGASFGLHIEWDEKLGRAPVNLLARGRQHAESDRGAQADLRFTVGIYGDGRALAGAFVQGTWANAKSTQSFYGVTPQQSSATGLPAFEPRSGSLYTSAGLLASLGLYGEWLAVGSLEARRLRGDAARSPFAERRSNAYASVGLAYRFR